MRAHSRRRSPAALLVLAAAALWGTTGTAQALLPAGSTPLTVAGVRVLLGGAVLALLVAARRGRPPSLGSFRSRRVAAGVLAGGLAAAAFQVSFFSAVGSAGVALGTVVAIGSAPVLTAVLAAATGAGLPSAREVLAIVLCVAGVAALSLGAPASAEAAHPRLLVGVLLALGAGASYAALTVAVKGLLQTGLPLVPAVAAVFGLAALVLLPVLAVSLPGGGLAWVATPRGLLLGAYLGLGPTVVSYLLYGRALATLQPARVATLSLAEPLVASLLGVLLLGERLGVVGGAGAGLVLAGLAVLAVGTGRGNAGVRRPAVGAESRR